MKNWGALVLFLTVGAALYAYRGELSRAMENPTVRSYVNPGPLSPGHSNLESRCEACHTPNGGVKAESCTVCHANNQRLLQRQPTAFHATVGECSACHFEHTSESRRPIQMDHSALAVIGARKAHGSQLEDQGSKSFVQRIVAAAQAPSPEGTLVCATCHSVEDRHVGLFGAECASCHATASWKIPGYRHPAESSLDCVQCHQAPPSHYMMHFEMVSMLVARVEHANVKQCYLCHRTTVWNDIRGVGYYKHH